MATTALVVAGAAWWLHRRQRRRAETEAEQRVRQRSELIEQAQCALWEADVQVETDDWTWQIKLHPSAFCRQLFGPELTVGPANFWDQFQIDTREQMDLRAREALQRGHAGYQQEFKAIRDGRTYWLQETVSITRLGLDHYRLVGLITDLTAQREAEMARRQSEQGLERILANAQCMLWRAMVTEEKGKLLWPHFDVPRSRLSERLFGAHRQFNPERGFWDGLAMPDQAKMDAHSSRAIHGNAPGYEQVFRVVTPAGATFHLHERVSITPEKTGTWSLVGVVTDITPQIEAEVAQKRTETTLAHLLERADSMIWQGRIQRQPDGRLDWKLFVPASQLFRKIFGHDPDGDRGFSWGEMGVPEVQEMEARSYRAITESAPGYEQVFHVPRSDRPIWLTETVTISPAGPNEWELVGIITDISDRHRVEEAWRSSQERLGNLLNVAECMLWEASVLLQADDTLTWDQYIPPSALYRRIFGETGDAPLQLHWSELQIPEYPDMVTRTLAALKAGAPGYTQEFRVVRTSGDIWLRETVSIQRDGVNRFRMAGVITDITAQRRAEEAHRASEVQLAVLLDGADCMIWQGQCRRMGPDDFNWQVFTPRSQLYRRIFGTEPVGECHFAWTPEQVPEFWEMRDRSRRAMLEGRTAYEQVFHCLHPAGDIWLQENVSIKSLGPDHWELTGIIANITAQRELQQARQASEKRLSELLGRANCLLWESTVSLLPDGWQWEHTIQPSLFYQRLTGAPEPLAGASMWPVERVPERPEMDRRCRDAILGGSLGYDQVFRFVSREGATTWISENVTVNRLGENRFWLVGVAVDITAQRTSELALQASEQRLLEILTRADCLLWEATTMLEKDSWKWEFNIQPSLLGDRLYGSGRPASARGLWREFTIPEWQEMNARCRQALEQGLPGYEQVFHIIQPDGAAVWIRENVTIRKLDVNRFSLVGVAVDITAQRGAEAALANEKERLAVTLRAMNEAVFTTDGAGVVQFANPAALNLVGRAGTDCVGRPVQEVCTLENVRDGARVLLPIARVAQGDLIADLPGQTRLVGADGRRRLIEGCCAPIRSADSQVTGTVLVMRDVTEQDRLEQELIRATRLESVGVLAGGIAHDFNNILTAVMGNLALAQLDIAPGSPAMASLRSAEKAALRARDLTQQLLTFAKGGDPVRAAIQLETVVREMAGFALHGSSIKASYDLAPDLWAADADKGQIGRVVQNLVINSVQAMPKGGSLRISARNDPQAHLAHPGLAAGDYIQIAISDSGAGINPENLSRIFDPYFTTKQTGTGLGLAAVYSIIRKHRGHIEVESQVGQGTTFRFWLPALNCAVAKPDTNTPWATTKTHQFAGRVLFMDDEQIIRDMATSLLERFGLKVDCAADGAEAVAKYQSALQTGRAYDLVITDLTVPGGMGGLAALGKLRELDPQVKAVVSSGYSSDPVLANYRQHGFSAVMAKPYEVGEVARVLRELLPAG
ncbi:PAS domain S-box protein [Oleiharenicola lentus]|nr:PAS domain S-box protein [Oleiharenicola lentus]